MRIPSRVLVISDLHLGGRPAYGGNPAFQICGEAGRQRLAKFLEWVASLAGESIHLVLAGDVVDFLAEERPDGFSAFTADDAVATRKLKTIFGDADENAGVPVDALSATRAVWERLAGVVRSGAMVTILLGNHDIELSLPGPRRELLDRLGPGRLEFLYDNEALTIGKILIEHGNRYDDWNAVPHDRLRQVRSHVSRKEAASFDPLPGSIMVRDLVNVLKPRLRFVDLLKPETAALLPFLAFLAPSEYRRVAVVLKERVRAARVKFDSARAPIDPDYVAAQIGAPISGVPIGTGDARDDEMVALADAIAAGGGTEVAAGDGFLASWRRGVAAKFRDMQLDLLLRTLRAWSGAHDAAFALAVETQPYLDAATNAASRGFDAVVFGHTHLAKRVTLEGGAVYLNTGTWADLMAIPRAIIQSEPASARKDLEQFADDLATNNTERWRAFVPTFADIALAKSGGIVSADLRLFESQHSQPVLTQELYVTALERHA